MPKRSNEFQELIYLINLHAVGSSKATESKMLIDLLTGKEREVDICLEGSLGGHHITVSIECTASQRKATVEWVEKMKAKHERLPTNALVLVSKSGYTEEAMEVAAKYDIETLTLDEIDSSAVDRLFAKTNAIYYFQYSLTLMKVTARVEKVNGLPAENVATVPENNVFKADETQLGTIKSYIDTILKEKTFVEMIGRQLNKTHKSFNLTIDNPIDGEGGILFLRKEDPVVFRKIESINIYGGCDVTPRSKFDLKHGKLGNVKVSWGSSKFLNKETLLVVTEDDAGEKKLTIRTRRSK